MRRRSRQQQPALLAALSLVLVALATTAYAQDCLPGKFWFDAFISDVVCCSAPVLLELQVLLL